jgi:uncharacterized protein (DUF2225 family)
MSDNNQPEVNIMDFIYPKTFQCSVCDWEFMSFIVKRSKLRVASRDADLRTHYHHIDPNPYDILMCSHCGYTALSAYFDRITDKQITLIRQNIMAQYNHREHPIPLSPEHALERYKMALLCAVTIGAKASVKAIICLKIAWQYRDIGNESGEMQFMRNALSGLKEAYGSEPFPLAGLDEFSAQLTIAELSRRTGDSAEAMRWISRLVTAKGVPAAIKDRAVDIKELLKTGG